MACYNFTVDTGDPASSGSSEADLPDLRAAETEAVEFAGAMIRDLGATFWERPELRLQVTDGEGHPLLALSCKGRRAYAAA